MRAFSSPRSSPPVPLRSSREDERRRRRPERRKVLSSSSSFVFAGQSDDDDSGRRRRNGGGEKQKRFFRTRAKAQRRGFAYDDDLSNNNNNNNKPPMQQRVLTKFLELPTVPIGQYVASPTSYLHKMDSRLKQAWLMALLLCPSYANEPIERVYVCLFLVLASATSLPRKVWGSHTRNLGLLALALFVFAAIGSDGVPLLTQPREPAAVLEGLENVEGIALATSYKYAVLNFGPIHVTRRGVTIATNAACVTFTALQSAHMALCTTTPESLAFAMRWYLMPLKKVFKVETDEIVFTLLLALRFTSIVFEETRNLSLGLASRGLDWKSLGFRGSIDVFVQFLARLMDSLFANAKAISEAAESRGYNSNSEYDDDFFDNERGYGTQDNSKPYVRIENFVGALLLCAFVLHFSDFDFAKVFTRL
jgi:energy-coupling factor transporter transmembrane protein EcfT